MKKSFILFATFFVIGLFATWGVTQFTTHENEEQYENEEENEAAEIAGAMQHRLMLTKNYDTGEYNPMDYFNAMKQAKELINQAGASRGGDLNLVWEELGPDNVGGRTRAIVIDNANHERIYAGGVGGGLFISEDGALNWRRVYIDSLYMPINCIAQAPNGDLYMGTGEAFYGVDGTGLGGAGTPGNGIYKSTDRGETWTHLNSTSISASSVTNQVWSYVSALGVDPSNSSRIFAGTKNGGLFLSIDAGLTWTSIVLPGPPASSQSFVYSVKFGADGSLVYVTAGSNVWQSQDHGSTFNPLTFGATPVIPTTIWSSVRRSKIAIAPSNDNVAYVLGANSAGCIQTIILTEDKGISWRRILASGSTLDMFKQVSGAGGCQGDYDMAIGVSTGDPFKLYVGGVTLYAWNYTWNKADNINAEPFSDLHYVHADKHTVVFDPTDPEIAYIGTDGGVFRSDNATSGHPSPLFRPRNNKYNVTQNYSMSAGIDGSVACGNQDNGTQLNRFNGNTLQSCEEVFGGDGAYPEISILNPKIMFAGSQYASYARSVDGGNSFGGFYNAVIDPDGNNEPGSCDNCNAFIAVNELVETRTAINNLTQVSFTAETNLAAGTVVKVKSSVSKDVFFDYTLPSSMIAGENIMVTDVVDSKFFLSTVLFSLPATLPGGPAGSGLWMLKNPLDNVSNPIWFKVGNIPSNSVIGMGASKDADILYAGSGSNLYKISGLNSAADYSTPPLITGLTITTISLGGSRPITGIYVDQNDDNHVVVTRGGYGSGAMVQETTTGSGPFTDISANLPQMPIYDVVIDAGNSDNYIVGTELGVWTSANGGASWSFDGDLSDYGDIGFTPVYRVRQRPLHTMDCQVIYLGTHGRGMFRTVTLTNSGCATAIGIDNPKAEETLNMSLFPNPATDNVNLTIDATKASNVEIGVFDLNGRKLQATTTKLATGTNRISMNLNGYSQGYYIVSVFESGKLLGSRQLIVK